VLLGTNASLGFARAPDVGFLLLLVECAVQEMPVLTDMLAKSEDAKRQPLPLVGFAELELIRVLVDTHV